MLPNEIGVFEASTSVAARLFPNQELPELSGLPLLVYSRPADPGRPLLVLFAGGGMVLSRRVLALAEMAIARSTFACLGKADLTRRRPFKRPGRAVADVRRSTGR